MNVFLDTNKAKQQAKHLATYLASLRKRLTHAQALEAVARMYGAREWNALAAKLEEQVLQPSANAARGEPVFLADLTGGNETVIEVKATLRLDDNTLCYFDVQEWFAEASEADILEMAGDGWAGDYSVDELAFWARDRNDAGVVLVFGQQDSANANREDGEEKMGFEVSVNKQHAWRFCRAFRYATFVKLALIEQFGGLGPADVHIGIRVVQDPDQPGKWLWRLASDGSDVSFDTEDKAWEDLGLVIENSGDFNDWLGDESVLSVERSSGVKVAATVLPQRQQEAKEDLVAGRFDNRVGYPSKALVLPASGPHLTHRQLRNVTNDGEHRVCIAVSVPMSTLIDGDIEELNDFVSEAVTGNSGDLSDLGFERHSPEGEAELHDMKQNVFILVNAAWDPIDGLED